MGPPPRHPSLPTGYLLRRPSAADAEAVAALKRTIETDRYGESDVTAGEVLDEWSLPGLSLEDDVWVVEDDVGLLVAYALCWLEAPPDEAAAEQLVAPSHRARGLNELLLGLCETRAAELATSVAPGNGVSLEVWAHESDARRLELLARRGYRRQREFLRLERDLDDGFAPPIWPAGIRVASFRAGVDDAVVHAAFEEAFADQYGSGEPDLERWLQSRFAHGGPDLGLWLVAWDGAEAVGGIEATETPSGAYMGDLWVRPPWRGRGIARALMLEECAELRRRGMRTAFFGVDAANATGALQLHASLGFRSVRGAVLLFEKRVGRS
jgi:mycothiol synthase